MKVIPDKKYPDMYRIDFEDGTFSDRNYNIEWAKEHVARWEGEILVLDQIYNSPMARSKGVYVR